MGLEQSIFTRLVAKNNAASPRVDEDKSDEPNEASIEIKLPCGHGSFPLPRALLQNLFMNFKLFQTSRKRRLHLFFLALFLLLCSFPSSFICYSWSVIKVLREKLLNGQISFASADEGRNAEGAISTYRQDNQGVTDGAVYQFHYITDKLCKVRNLSTWYMLRQRLRRCHRLQGELEWILRMLESATSPEALRIAAQQVGDHFASESHTERQWNLFSRCRSLCFRSGFGDIIINLSKKYQYAVASHLESRDLGQWCRPRKGRKKLSTPSNK